MKPVREMSQTELAAFVQDHLWAQGIHVVLSGGAVAGFYSRDRYVSQDIDLVNVRFAERGEIETVMKKIGFNPVGRHFEHPDTDQIIEFPPGPLTLGSEKIVQIQEIVLETGLLRTLSPTDCVKDRLSHYYHWGDRQCLEQAKWVAANHRIDLEAIRKWSVREGKEKSFKEIADQLE